MVVLCDNIFGTGSDGAIYKLVIIRVGLYQSEAKMRVDKPHIATCHNDVNNSLGGTRADITTNNLDIFLNNLIGNAQRVLIIKKCLPSTMVKRAVRDGYQQAVGI